MRRLRDEPVRHAALFDPQRSDEKTIPGSTLNVRLSPVDPTDYANQGVNSNCNRLLFASRKIPCQVIPHKGIPDSQESQMRNLSDAGTVRFRRDSESILNRVQHMVQNDMLEIGIFRKAEGTSLQPLRDIDRGVRGGATRRRAVRETGWRPRRAWPGLRCPLRGVKPRPSRS